MRFSVIIPLYNKMPYIRKALESVATQSFRDFELIVIDDGSTDGSLVVAQQTLREKPGLKYTVLQQANAGVSTARNNGVAASSGDFICFLDADDWWEPTYLEKMNGFIRDYPEAGIYGTNYYYVKSGRRHICVENLETGYIHYCQAYASKLQMPLWTGAVCIPRRIFEEFDGFRPHLRLGEDFDLWIKVALKYKVAFYNEPLSNYFQDSDATWRGIGHLTSPKYHMLWNLDYLADQEMNNPDYKQLIDNLRTYSLQPYYLSSKYRDAALQELEKVDWDKQQIHFRRFYQRPIWFLKSQRIILVLGSKIKQWLIKHL